MTTTAMYNPNPAAERGSSFQGPKFQGASRLFDLVTGAWAITPAMLTELQEVYATHLRGEKINVSDVEASLGRPLANQQRGFDVIDGIAVLPVQGIIAPKVNLMMQISGGASAQLLQRDLAQAVNDPRVSGIVLSIDSPGGSVFGTPDLAAQVYAARDIKPIIAHTDGQMASAAYWIGSAAAAVYNSGPTVMVGSIGVVQRHVNTGVGDRVTEITAGKYKRIASTTGPLSEEGRAHMQAQVDYFYSLFVDAVAAHRGVSIEQALEDMADGRLFIGQQAIDAGLVDGALGLDALVAQMAQDPQSVTRRAAPKRRSTAKATSDIPSPEAVAGDAPAQGPIESMTPGAGDVPAETSIHTLATHPLLTQMKGNVMHQADNTITRESLERDQPALFAQLRTDFSAEGAAQERDRIRSVREQALPGHDALIERLAADGATNGPQAAAAVLAAERGARAASAAAHAGDAPQPVPASHTAAGSEVKTKDQQVAQAKAYAAENKVDFVAAFKALGFAS